MLLGMIAFKAYIGAELGLAAAGFAVIPCSVSLPTGRTAAHNTLPQLPPCQEMRAAVQSLWISDWSLTWALPGTTKAGTRGCTADVPHCQSFKSALSILEVGQFLW